MRDIVSPLDGLRSPFGPVSGGAAAFTPASLFASGEEGAWYEPSTTTAFLSTTDLTPCGVGDSCGFLLDKSQGAGYSGSAFTGLGSELVTNGTFDSNITGWTADGGYSASWSGGELIGTDVGSSGGVGAPISVEAGKSYLVSGTMRRTTPGSQLFVAIRDSATWPGTALAASTAIVSGTNTTESFVYTAASTGTVYFWFVGDGAGNTSFAADNASVRELPGNHATQGTAAARPILRQTAGGLYYLEFDGVDDWLSVSTSAFPVSSAGVAAKMKTVSGYRGILVNTSDQATNGDFALLTENAAFFISQSAGNGLFGFVDKNGASGSSFSLNETAVFYGDATGFPATAQLQNGAKIGQERNGAAHALIDLFGLVSVDRILTSEERSDLETYLADLSGVTL